MARSAARDDARLLAAYLRPERARVAALSAVLLVGVLLPLAGPVLLGRALDRALDGSADGTGVLALAYLATTVGGDLLQLAVTWWSVSLAWRVGNRLRADLAAHALSLELAWHGDHSPGLLIERVDGDVDAIVRFSSTAVLQLIGNLVLLVGVLGVVTVLEWRAGLAIGATAAAAALVMVHRHGRAVPAHDAEREVTGRLIGDLEERLGGLEDLRSNGAGAYVVHRLHEHSAQWWRVMRRVALVGDGAVAWTAGTFALGSVVTLGLGLALHRRGDVSIGLVLTLFRYSQLVRQPVERVAEQLREAQKAAAGARRAGRLLATRPRVVDGPGAEPPPGALSLELRDVRFGYGPGPATVGPIDLFVPAGTSLGVIGRTGSGKTTLGRLVLRLWDVDGGQVLVGGEDVRRFTTAQLRRRVAVVTQDVELFRTTVRENLTLFGTVAADDARLEQVLRDVGLGPWLDGLDHGLDSTITGTGGLSSGQAQLLATARVLLADPGLAVLDEATSRLDDAAEAAVTAASARLLAGRTVVVIAHRLATLDHVDRICVLEDGLVVEEGPRAALAADPASRYARLRARSGDAAGADREVVG